MKFVRAHTHTHLYMKGNTNCYSYIFPSIEPAIYNARTHTNMHKKFIHYTITENTNVECTTQSKRPTKKKKRQIRKTIDSEFSDFPCQKLSFLFTKH